MYELENEVTCRQANEVMGESGIKEKKGAAVHSVKAKENI